MARPPLQLADPATPGRPARDAGRRTWVAARAPWLLAAAALATLAALPGTLQAQAADDPSTERARALFNEAIEHSDAGDWERAAHRLTQALELRDAPSIRFNLGVALSHLGRLRESSGHLEAAARAEDADAALRAQAEERLTQVRAQLGHLRVQVQDAPEAAVVTVDGEPWTRLGAFAPADPGIRQVRLMLGPEVLVAEDADVPEGGETSVTLRVEAAIEAAVQEAAAPEASDDDGGSDDSAVIAGVLLGVGAAVIAGGVITGVVLADQLGPRPSDGDFDPPVLRSGT